MRDRAAVAGIGMTALTRESGRTELELAVEASRAACADAGIEPGEVDAVLSYHMNDSAPVVQVASALRIEPLGWHNDITGGGTQAASILGEAAMLIAAGLARTVLVYRALNGRSGTRMNTVSTGPQERFTVPYGMAGPIPMFALAAQRYLHETGLTQEHLHAVVAQSRENAAANPGPCAGTRSLWRTTCPGRTSARRCGPSTAARRPTARARWWSGTCGWRPRPPHPHGGAGRRPRLLGHGPRAGRHRDLLRPPRPLLWERSGMKPGEVDVALLYDAYSWLVPRQLEDFGLVARAELGEFLLRRGHAGVNPHGGLLSEGYVHGLNNVAQAVRELRAGRRTALVTGFGGSYGSAALLTRGV
nr:hypothetical protein GCM10020093_102540 [Planobispora longispora]